MEVCVKGVVIPVDLSEELINVPGAVRELGVLTLVPPEPICPQYTFFDRGTKSKNLKWAMVDLFGPSSSKSQRPVANGGLTRWEYGETNASPSLNW